MMKHYVTKTRNFSGGRGYHLYCPNDDTVYICNGQRVRYGYDRGLYCSSGEERISLEEFVAVYSYKKCPICGKDLI